MKVFALFFKYHIFACFYKFILMQKLSLLIFMAIVLLSCTKYVYQIDEYVPKEDSTEAFEIEFAKALSKLIASNDKVVSFINREKYLEYTMYWSIKDKQVYTEGPTFRELLLLSFEDKSILERIEQELPTIRIFFSEYILLNKTISYNVKWSDDIKNVSYTSDNPKLFVDGKEVSSYKYKEIPDIPILIVDDGRGLEYLLNN